MAGVDGNNLKSLLFQLSSFARRLRIRYTTAPQFTPSWTGSRGQQELLKNRQNLNQNTYVDVVEETQAPLKADIAQLKTDVTELKTDVAGLKTDVAGLKTDFAGLKTDVAGLKSTVDQILVFLQNGGAPQPTKGR